MKRLALALVCGGLVIGSALAPVARSAAPVDPALVARATQFRTTSGFKADPAYVQRSLVDSAAFPDDRYSVPLTRPEAAEIQRRIDVELALTPAIEWAAAQPEFGGWYMDQLGGGVPVLLVAGDPTAFGKSVAEVLDRDLDYRVLAVANAQRVLLALEDQIWADRAELAKDGIDVQGVSLHVRSNAVRIEVAGLTDQTTKELVARYGSVETVENVPAEFDACNSRLDCAPPKGGIQIVNVQHTTSTCTIGFNVMLQSNRNRRVLTAGHCLIKSPNVLGNGWKHHGVQIGTGSKAIWADGANYDVGLITQPDIPGDDNLVYWGSNTDRPHVKGWRITAAQGETSLVCRSAWKSGFWCGHVTATEQIKNVDGFDIHHMWVVDFDAIAGDSGGPYGMETAADTFIAWGTHSDSTGANPPGGSAWYLPFGYALQGLQGVGSAITLCTDPVICANS